MIPTSGVNKAVKRDKTQIVFSLTKGEGKFVANIQATLTTDGVGVVDQSSKIGLKVLNSDSVEAVIKHLEGGLAKQGFPEFIEDVRPSIKFLWDKVSE